MLTSILAKYTMIFYYFHTLSRHMFVQWTHRIAGTVRSHKQKSRTGLAVRVEDFHACHILKKNENKVIIRAKAATNRLLNSTTRQHRGNIHIIMFFWKWNIQFYCFLFGPRSFLDILILP